MKTVKQMTKKLTINETADFLRNADNYIIITHARPDGDTLCSAAALLLGLREIGKAAYLAPNRGTTARYMEYVGEYFAPEGFVADTVLSVDTATEDMFPLENAEYKGKVALAIDHHGSNSLYAENILLDSDSAACGEIVYAVLIALCGSLTPDMAKQVYIAITTDTGCFAYLNTTATTLRIASEAVKAGAPHRDINKALFRTKSRSRLALEGAIYAGLEYHFNDTCAISTITLDMLKESGADENDLDDIAAIPGGIEGVHIGITVKEQKNGVCKISVRTTPRVSANKVCAKFGGGGHAMASGCTIAENPETTKKLLIEAIAEIWQ